MVNQGQDYGYRADRPWRKEIEYNNGEQHEYVPLWDVSKAENHHRIEFSLSGRLGRNQRREIAIEPSPVAFTELFFPDTHRLQTAGRPGR